MLSITAQVAVYQPLKNVSNQNVLEFSAIYGKVSIDF